MPGYPSLIPAGQSPTVPLVKGAQLLRFNLFGDEHHGRLRQSSLPDAYATLCYVDAYEQSPDQDFDSQLRFRLKATAPPAEFGCLGRQAAKRSPIDRRRQSFRNSDRMDWAGGRREYSAGSGR